MIKALSKPTFPDLTIEGIPALDFTVAKLRLFIRTKLFSFFRSIRTKSFIYQGRRLTWKREMRTQKDLKSLKLLFQNDDDIKEVTDQLAKRQA